MARMLIGDRDTQEDVVLIAEVGNNHEGSVSEARKLITGAFEAGADAVKLQTFVPHLVVAPTQKERLQQLEGFALPIGFVQEEAEKWRGEGKTLFTTPLDMETLSNLGWLGLIKISSGDITFVELLQSAALQSDRLIISTGASTLEEVAIAVSSIESMWMQRERQGELAILHCVSAYPAPIEQLNLKAIASMRVAFPNVVVGYSDHTVGIDACVWAVIAGARIVEKHFTLDHNRSSFRDHQLSANPAEMELLRSKLDSANAALGSGAKIVQSCELSQRGAIRRSPYFSRNLNAGDRVQHGDIVCLRPFTGTQPSDLAHATGRILNDSALTGEPATPEHLA